MPINTNVVSSNPAQGGVLDTALCDKLVSDFVAGRWPSLRPTVSSINNTNRHDIVEILLKVVLNNRILTLQVN